MATSVDRTLGAKIACEFIGTLALLYVGIMVITIGVPSGAGLVGVALAHGLVIAVFASATMMVSGGHFNPAVTISVWAGRRIPGSDAIAYVLAQLAGGIAGSLLARLSLPAGMTIDGGIPAVAASISPTTAILIEAVLTFFLVFVIFGTGVDERFGGRVGGLAIGLTVTLDIFAGGPLTGAAMNPARWFGPALLTGNWANMQVWIIGPLLGGILASALWTWLLLPAVARRSPTEPSP